MSYPGFENYPELTEDLKEKAEQILAFLELGARGKGNAIHSAEIEKKWGLTGPQTRKIMGYLRLSEKLIGSCDKGYYIIKTEADAFENYESLRHRASAIMACANSIRNAAYKKWGWDASQEVLPL